MTIAELIALARVIRLGHERNMIAELADAVTDLLAEDAPCGWEMPSTITDVHGVTWVCLPDWRGVGSPDDARALARMPLSAADLAEAKK